MFSFANDLIKSNLRSAINLIEVNDIVDQGGNIALNSAGCDGIFISEGATCMSFLSLANIDLPVTEEPTSSLIPFPSPITNSPVPRAPMKPSSCMTITNDEAECIQILSYNDFKEAVQSFRGVVILCPFKIERFDGEDPLDVGKKIRVTCKERHKCIINGSETHLRVSGESAEIFMQGFKFTGATKSAVIIKGTILNQVFCDCIFSE